MARLVDLDIILKDGTFVKDPVQSDVDGAAITCQRFEMGGVAPTDLKSGHPKGSREYAGITIHKRLDGASPGLFKLFAYHIGFKAVFQIHKVNSSTSDEPSQVALTVTIGGDEYMAWISSYKLVVPDVETRAENDPEEPYEVVVFSFSKIVLQKSGTNHAGEVKVEVVDDSLVGVL